MDTVLIWTGIVISLVAALMATPTVFSLIWGSPKIVLSFDRHEADWGRALTCEIRNQPIKNRLGRILVRRDAIIDADVTFRILQANTGEVILSEVRPEIRLRHGDEEVVPYLNLPPSSTLYRWFSVVTWNEGQSMATTAEKSPRPLGRSEYLVKIMIDGSVKGCKTFIVGDNPRELRWRCER